MERQEVEEDSRADSIACGVSYHTTWTCLSFLSFFFVCTVCTGGSGLSFT